MFRARYSYSVAVPVLPPSEPPRARREHVSTCGGRVNYLSIRKQIYAQEFYSLQHGVKRMKPFGYV